MGRRKLTNGLRVLRPYVEFVVHLGLAVILFRTYVAEGFMISTGSMAPSLLGYHRRVVCPSCHFEFARGVHVADDGTVVAQGSDESVDAPGEHERARAICPNCGLASIDVSSIATNEGDQMLVQKQLFDLRPPRRWEMAVFRSPHEPELAYVKRIVGLPEEQIQLRSGDVYANGVLQRKSLSTQRDLRMLVYDLEHAPTDEEWNARWVRTSPESHWTRIPGGLSHQRTAESQNGDSTIGHPELDWIAYRHWIRSGGTHRTSVPTSDWPATLPPPESLLEGLEVDDQSGLLSCRGVLARHDLERLLQIIPNGHEKLREDLEKLARASHIAPITDLYGYNSPDAREIAVPVHDLMASVRLEHLGGKGSLHLRMHDGWHQFDCELDFGKYEVRLWVDGASKPARRKPLPVLLQRGGLLEMSLFDRQVIIAINGELVLTPLRYAEVAGPRISPPFPVEIGASQIEVRLTNVQIFRDVHYTADPANVTHTEFVVGADEYFMLGDNSPVSLDSRFWPVATVPGRLLIGRPFVVHLPSRQGEVHLGGRTHHIRIPDLSRVHYIP